MSFHHKGGSDLCVYICMSLILVLCKSVQVECIDVIVKVLCLSDNCVKLIADDQSQ